MDVLTKPGPEALRLLNFYLTSKFLTAKLLCFARDEYFFTIMRGLGEFNKNDLADALERELGYCLGPPVKRRMISVIVDFFKECGIVGVRDGSGGPFYLLSGDGQSLYEECADITLRERKLYEQLYSGQVEFLSKCVDEAPKFLRGGQNPFDFSESKRADWEMFLGNYEFRTMRMLLLRLMNIPDKADVRVLDLCFGLGHGVSDILLEYNNVHVTALDKTGVYIDAAMDRVGRLRSAGISQADVQWMFGQWEGFSGDLPFEDNSFEAVHFACSDPYIPGNLREALYREVHRVLKPAGVLGVLTWPYPKSEGVVTSSPWVRRQILAHDFAESVCLGWQGFSCIDDNMKMFAKLGFLQDELSASFCGEMMAQSICVLRKG